MATFDNHRPGPDVEITQAINAEDSLGDKTTIHSQLRSLVDAGLPALAIAATLAGGTGIVGIDTANAQETQIRSDQSAYPGPDIAAPEPQGVTGDESAYPAPAEQQPDQEATVEPSAATPEPPTEAVHRVYLPFGLASGKPRETATATESATEAPTETTTAEPTETTVPSPTASSTPITPTSEPSATATELPIATETPAPKEVLIGSETILYQSGDQNSLWAKPKDIHLAEGSYHIVGKTHEGLVMAETDLGRFLVQAPEGIDLVSIPEIITPHRHIAFADSTSPIRMSAGSSDKELQYLPVTLTAVGANQGYEYSYSGEIGEGTVLNVHHDQNFTLSLARGEGSDYVFGYKGPDGNRSTSLNFDTHAGPIHVRLSPSDSGNRGEVIQTVEGNEVVLGQIDVGSLKDSRTYLSVVGGNAYFNGLDFDAAPSQPADNAQLDYIKRLDSGIKAKTGIEVGMGYQAAIGSGPEHIRGHGLAQKVHFDLGFGYFDSPTYTLGHQTDYIREEFRAAKYLGLNPVVHFTFNTEGSGTRGADEIQQAITDLKSVGESSDLAINVIRTDGKIDISKGALEAFGFDRPSTISAAGIISNLTSNMGSVGQADLDRQPQVNLKIPYGFNAKYLKELRTSITGIQDRGAHLDGAYVYVGENSTAELKQILIEMKSLGLKTTLLGVDGTHQRAPLAAIADLKVQGLIDGITITDGSDSRSRSLVILNDGTKYNQADPNGGVKSTPFGEFMGVFEGLN